MTIDVSLIVADRRSGPHGLTAEQSLHSLEMVDRLAEAKGTWVMFIPDVESLDRHAAKNLLLAAEEAGASAAMSGARAEVEVLTAEQLCSQVTLLDLHGVLLNREWLQSQSHLMHEITGGVRQIPTSALGAIQTVVMIPQTTFITAEAMPVPGSVAAIQADPVSQMAGRIFSVARKLPLGTRIVIALDGRRASDSALSALPDGLRAHHRKARVVEISKHGRLGLRQAWQLGRARWVLTNDRFISPLPKRQGQQLLVVTVETPVVRSGRDNPDWVLQPVIERRPSWAQVHRWDLVVTSSPFATQVLRSSSGYAGPVLEGVSLFADAMAAALSEADLHARLGLESSLPLVLLALSTARTQLSLESLARAFAERLQFVVITDDLSTVDARQAHEDVPSWCAAADLMVTEWSSLSMEFGVLQRPIVAFQPDAVDVVRRRGTYVDLTQALPGPCIGSTGELIEQLESWLAHGDQAWPEFAERSAAFAALGCQATDGAAARILEALADPQ